MTTKGRDAKGTGPVDIDAERAVACVVAANPALFDEIQDVVTADDFHDPAARALFTCVSSLENSGRPVDAITVSDEAKRLKLLTAIGGKEGVEGAFQLASGYTANLTTYVDIVVEKARLRRAISVGREICDAAMQVDAEAPDVIEVAETAVFSLNAKERSNTLLSMGEAIPKVVAELTKTRGSVLAGHSTGLDDLDRLTGGFQPGQLWVIAARPGVGKSALALQMARSVAESTGLAVPFLSYEMSVAELGTRMIASAMGVSMTDLRDGTLPSGAERELGEVAMRLSDISVLIDDNPPSTIAGVRSQMRRLARRSEVGAIFVDYLQLMEGSRRSIANRNDEVSEISRGLKRLAAELGVPVIALSQLNRNVEMRGGTKRPQLSDLRDSGAVEQDANTICFVYRESMVNHQADPTLAELIVAKQRSGPTGSVYMDFNGASARFDNTNRRPMMSGGAAPSSAGFGNNSNPF